VLGEAYGSGQAKTKFLGMSQVQLRSRVRCVFLDDWVLFYDKGMQSQNEISWDIPGYLRISLSRDQIPQLRIQKWARALPKNIISGSVMS
jgi:hypothetical protein